MNVLDELIGRATDAIEAGGALALLAVMLIENLFPPIPSEAVLPLAGFTVQEGRLGLGVAVLAATAGSVLGAWALYGIGRYGGRPLVNRFHWLLRLDEEQLDRVDDWFDRHGSAVVLWARMVPFARSAVSVPAGMSEMPFLRFSALTALGSLFWNTLLISSGMLLGERWGEVSDAADAYGTAVLGALVLAGAAYWLWKRRRRRSDPQRG